MNITFSSLSEGQKKSKLANVPSIYLAENVIIMIPAPRRARFQLLDDHDRDDWEHVDHRDARSPRRLTRAAARRNGETFVVVPRGD